MSETPLDCGSPANRAVLLDPQVFYVCERCTACCKWPGDVRLQPDEIPPVAAHLGLDVDTFIARFTRLRANRQGLSLVEKANHECIMLEGDRCLIHPVKPAQCRGFPNQWRFPGWRDLCQARPIPLATARARGLVDTGD